jgi:hypothetical protein
MEDEMGGTCRRRERNVKLYMIYLNVRDHVGKPRGNNIKTDLK